MSPDELKAEKKSLRATVLAARALLSAESRVEASAKILATIRQLPAYKNADTVLTYMGFGEEVETAPFFDAIRADGKIAVLPKINKGTNRADWMLSLHRVEEPEELAAGVWGIREPLPHLPLIDIAQVGFALIPGLAFDRTGGRLGYGGGFYDRLLLSARPSMVKACAAFSCQVVNAVSVGPNDRKIDLIITENELIYCT